MTRWNARSARVSARDNGAARKPSAAEARRGGVPHDAGDNGRCFGCGAPVLIVPESYAVPDVTDEDVEAARRAGDDLNPDTVITDYPTARRRAELEEYAARLAERSASAAEATPPRFGDVAAWNAEIARADERPLTAVPRDSTRSGQLLAAAKLVQMFDVHCKTSPWGVEVDPSYGNPKREDFDRLRAIAAQFDAKPYDELKGTNPDYIRAAYTITINGTPLHVLMQVASEYSSDIFDEVRAWVAGYAPAEVTA